jgi:hypothetical protein
MGEVIPLRRPHPTTGDQPLTTYKDAFFRAAHAAPGEEEQRDAELSALRRLKCEACLKEFVWDGEPPGSPMGCCHDASHVDWDNPAEVAAFREFWGDKW